jgi:hypothetical protein
LRDGLQLTGPHQPIRFADRHAAVYTLCRRAASSSVFGECAKALILMLFAVARRQPCPQYRTPESANYRALRVRFDANRDHQRCNRKQFDGTSKITGKGSET